MINKLKNIKPKRNKEILLILILMLLLIFIFAPAGFLGIDQAEIDTEQLTKNEEVLVETNKVDTKSSQSEKDSKSNPEKPFNNNENSYTPETIESDLIKGTTTKSDTKSRPTISKIENPQTQFVVLEIDTGTDSHFYSVSWQEDMSVYDVLVEADKDTDFTFEAIWYGGFSSYYITEINGVGCCWVYKVNGENVSVGVYLKIINSGDIIIWAHT